jgi:hypothetical protein
VTRTVVIEHDGQTYTYKVGDCSTCHRTSVRFYSPDRCFYCTRKTTPL